MPSQAYQIVEENLMFLGDILCAGIIKKGLERVGSMPETATAGEMEKALSIHIENALVSFVGPKEARAISINIKHKLSRVGPRQGGMRLG